ncbi:MAG: DUF393 domain-containing protein [Pseudazoarcus pumilus]|nr:DUF393 domain-containing protein [Pseudazoarcus pumilus]
MPDEKPVTVFYDGACPRCVKDRADYERMAGDGARDVAWCDITGRDEELRAQGIAPDAALRELHVRAPDGRVLRELDAYILLMSRVPRLRPLAWLIGLPGVRPLCSWAYRWSVDRRLRREGRMPG